jgi:dissimilatory sulfite reductase (desulfoviridin) alpha/beta subunit
MVKDADFYTRGGVIPERDPDFCIVRLRIPAGMITPGQMRTVADIAERFGAESLHLTARQTMEIPHVSPDCLLELVTALEKNKTPLGAERDEIVNVTACMGTRHCKYGNIDSLALAREIDRKFFGKDMPVKVRIAISSCPNGCASERLNEIGITGIRKPIRDPDLCTGCGTCMSYCREKALSVSNGMIILDPQRCMQCGFCVMPCPFHVLKAEEPAYRITVGGRRGRHPKIGRHLVTVRTQDEVLKVVDRVIYWVYRRASSSVLLPEQLDDLEFDAFKNEILSMVSPVEIR